MSNPIKFIKNFLLPKKQTLELVDNLREGYNPDNDYLQPNSNGAEQSSDIIDLYSSQHTHIFLYIIQGERLRN